MGAGTGMRTAPGRALDRAVELASNSFLPALGGRPDPGTLARSPRFSAGVFRNPTPQRWMPTGSTEGLLRDMLRPGKRRRPRGPVPLVREVPEPTKSGLHVTWFGHASTLVEIDGARLLFDPIWSARASPVPGLGPKRTHATPRELDQLPALDAVVISHDHYDHLDMPTVRALARTRRVPFVVPLGVAAHLRHWGVRDDRIVELDWEQSTEVAGARLTATAAQHFSGRALTRNNTLWASWVVAGTEHRLFYTGDSGYFPGYAEIGARHGPFDAGIVQIGAYNAAWPDVHMTPEDGVAAHRDVCAELLVPVHWATFNLSTHGWGEPAERVWAEAKACGVTLAVPRPGERVDVAAPPAVDGWWKAVE